MMILALILARLSFPLLLVLAAAEQAPNATSTSPSNSNNTSSSAPNNISSAFNTLLASVVLNGTAGVSGQITFTLGSTTTPSEDVDVSISISGLNALNASAEYTYHIHTNPISSDGNCSSALAHLDPLQVSDSIICDSLLPQYCQEGDLAGRHGKLPGNLSQIQLNYTDKFIRFWPQPFSILGRSVVVHAPNSTRLACGNITSIVDGTADSNGHPTGKSSTYVTDYPSKAPPAAGPKVAPFVGTSTDTAAIASITLPAMLPDVDSVPNVILTASGEIRTINSSLATVTLPVAIPAPTAFMYTPGAALPSQPPALLNSSKNSTAASSTGKSGSSSDASPQRGSLLLIMSISSSFSIILFL